MKIQSRTKKHKNLRNDWPPTLSRSILCDTGDGFYVSEKVQRYLKFYCGALQKFRWIKWIMFIFDQNVNYVSFHCYNILLQSSKQRQTTNAFIFFISLIVILFVYSFMFSEIYLSVLNCTKMLGNV